jgi:hypothetical protein
LPSRGGAPPEQRCPPPHPDSSRAREAAHEFMVRTMALPRCHSRSAVDRTKQANAGCGRIVRCATLLRSKMRIDRSARVFIAHREPRLRGGIVRPSCAELWSGFCLSCKGCSLG